MRRPRATLFTWILVATALVALAACAGTQTAPGANATPQRTIRVDMETNRGSITLELYPDEAPKTVANFLRYVDEGFYDNTLFHRVIRHHIIQGGGYERGMKPKKTHDPIPNEADNGLHNLRGTIAMARTMKPDSATSQFFINLADNPSLDFRSKDPKGWGYCVFGKVVEGMRTVNKIGKALTTKRAGLHNVPFKDVVIQSIRRAKTEG